MRRTIAKAAAELKAKKIAEAKAVATEVEKQRSDRAMFGQMLGTVKDVLTGNAMRLEQESPSISKEEAFQNDAAETAYAITTSLALQGNTRLRNHIQKVVGPKDPFAFSLDRDSKIHIDKLREKKRKARAMIYDVDTKASV